MGDLGKEIIATGFEKLTKVQEIAQSGHTARNNEKAMRQKLQKRKFEKIFFTC